MVNIKVICPLIDANYSKYYILQYTKFCSIISSQQMIDEFPGMYESPAF